MLTHTDTHLCELLICDEEHAWIRDLAKAAQPTGVGALVVATAFRVERRHGVVTHRPAAACFVFVTEARSSTQPRARFFSHPCSTRFSRTQNTSMCDRPLRHAQHNRIKDTNSHYTTEKTRSRIVSQSHLLAHRSRCAGARSYPPDTELLLTAHHANRSCLLSLSLVLFLIISLPRMPPWGTPARITPSSHCRSRGTCQVVAHHTLARLLSRAAQSSGGHTTRHGSDGGWVRARAGPSRPLHIHTHCAFCWRR